MAADRTHLWEYSLPKTRASEEDVVRVEERLGFKLPESYRTLLLAANGWCNFHEDGCRTSRGNDGGIRWAASWEGTIL
ncbi:SMI1/KNR4 family protein [Propionibacterium australiense]|uniref:SMI1/KNR4 family protein n=1 Tax=Propionibacterium australiense TaxID=119981 RepID=A0A8B3FM48_9ACTN|nr:SMI1/KNR4 family protein [Propionibacterium australiense]RLP13047.1 SMI1/KNR4 family protein [Propionibacterium australiense]